MLSMSLALAAHNICGNVQDSPDGFSPGWKTMTAQWNNAFSSNTTCLISPEDNNYCCEIEEADISGYSFGIGHSWRITLFDSGDGYVAGPVNGTTTGGGFTSMPAMVLHYAIELNSPANITYSVNHTLINISSYFPYNRTIWYEFNGQNATLCTECTDATMNLTGLADGNHTIIAYANTSYGAVKSLTAMFAIEAKDYAPVIDSSVPATDPSMTEQQSLEFAVNASDNNTADTLTITWYKDGTQTAQDSNYTFIANFTGTDDAGTYNITALVTDGVSTRQQTWTLTVTDVNQPPDLHIIGAQTAMMDEEFNLDVNATDGDDDTITYSTNTSVFTIAPSTGIVSFTPQQNGTHSILFTATDDRGNSSSEVVSFTIAFQNQPPVFDSFSPSLQHSMAETQSYSFAVNASDPQSTIPSFTWYLDSSLLATTSSSYTYGPSYSDSGTHNLTVIATDGLLSVRLNWTLTVTNTYGCGDSTCGTGESCSSCPGDCGACAAAASTGGGGGYASSSRKVTKSKRSEPVIIYSDTMLHSAIVYMDSDYSEITVKQDVPVPDTVLEVMNVYESVELGVSEGKVNKTLFVFKVHKGWLKAYNLTIDDVMIAKVEDGKPRFLKFESAGEDREAVYIQAQDLPGIFMLGTSTETTVLPEPRKEPINATQENMDVSRGGVIYQPTDEEIQRWLLIPLIFIGLLVIASMIHRKRSDSIPSGRFRMKEEEEEDLIDEVLEEPEEGGGDKAGRSEGKKKGGGKDGSQGKIEDTQDGRTTDRKAEAGDGKDEA